MAERGRGSTLKEGSVEFERVRDTADTGFTASKNARFNNTIIGLAVMDGGESVCGRSDGK